MLETSDPGWLPDLEMLAAIVGHPLTKTPPKPKGA